jgi:hypothetical protein
MKKYIVFAFITGLLASCQQKTPEQAVDSLATAPDTTAANTKKCYAYIKNRDTVSLTMNEVGNAVTGDLNYNLFEKDKNMGTIAGIVKGDTVIADYTFNAEGTKSVRQVVFLKKDGQLVEGFGPATEKDGKSVFTKLSALEFGDAIILSPVPCK